VICQIYIVTKELRKGMKFHRLSNGNLL